MMMVLVKLWYDIVIWTDNVCAETVDRYKLQLEIRDSQFSSVVLVVLL